MLPFELMEFMAIPQWSDVTGDEALPAPRAPQLFLLPLELFFQFFYSFDFSFELRAREREREREREVLFIR